MPTPEQIAYAAGFFDGEGHIRIVQHSRRCRTMMLQVTLVQSTAFPLDKIKEWFGGTTSVRLIKYKKEVRAMYGWQSSSGAAERFLRSVLPYLIVKKDEALKALEFRETFSPQHIAGGHKRMSDDKIRFRQECANTLKNLRRDKRGTALAAAKIASIKEIPFQ